MQEEIAAEIRRYAAANPRDRFIRVECAAALRYLTENPTGRPL